jgi:hypothetical protein
MASPFNPYVLTPIVVGTLSALCIAEERPDPSASATFQDVLRRVEVRDQDSGAILDVRARDDAPRRVGNLQFAIRQRGDDEVIIVLTARSMTADVFEQYLLKIDPALRAELARQKTYAQQQEQKKRMWEEAQRVKVPAVTGGRLRFGMSPADVKNVLGTPKQENVWQKAGGLTLEYDDLTLTFDGGLVDVEKPTKDADKPAGKPATRPARPQ